MGRKNDTPKRTPRRSPQVAKGLRNWDGAPRFRERLRRLISEAADNSRTAFARRIGVGTSHVTKWLDDGVEPRAGVLMRIAAETGVSLDWLLGGVDGDAVVYVGQARDNTTLARDLARYVERELTVRYPPTQVDDTEPYVWIVRQDAVLSAAVDGVVPDAERDIEETRKRKEGIQLVQHLHHAVARINERLEADGLGNSDPQDFATANYLIEMGTAEYRRATEIPYTRAAIVPTRWLTEDA